MGKRKTDLGREAWLRVRKGTNFWKEVGKERKGRKVGREEADWCGDTSTFQACWACLPERNGRSSIRGSLYSDPLSTACASHCLGAGRQQ